MNKGDSMHEVRNGAEEPIVRLDGKLSSLLFDDKYYASQVADLGEVEGDLRTHFASIGWKKGLNPHPLFSTRFYLGQVPSLSKESVDPLAHYLLIGDRSGIAPHALFDPRHYRQQVHAPGEVSLVHFLVEGYRTANPHPLFDSSYYRAQINARKGAIPLNLNPLLDYVLHGNDDGFDPHPLFHTVYYYLQRPDIASAEVTALDHYLRFGWKEGTKPHPLLDFEFYKDQGGECGNGNPIFDLVNRPTRTASTHPLFDLAYFRRQVEIRKLPESTNHPTIHYLTEAHLSGVSPHPLLDTNFYSRNCLSYSQAEGDPMSHYLAYGFREFANPHPMFDTHWYQQRHLHGQRQLMSPLEHYVRHWRDDPNLAPCWGFDSAHYLRMRPGCLTSNVTPPAHFYSYMNLPLLVPEETVTYVGGEHERLCKKYAQHPSLWRNKSPLRFIIVVHEATRSGAPLIILRVLKTISERLGAECFTLLQSGGELSEEFAKYSHVIDLAALRDSHGITNFSLHISAIARPGRTIALCNSAECASIGVLLSSLGIPTISLVHEFTSLYPETIVSKLCESSEAIVFPSQAVKNDAISHYGSHCKRIHSAAVLYHGLVHPQILLQDRASSRQLVVDELEIEADSFIVLGSGQIQNRKGIDLFILAAKEFCRRFLNRNVTFVWIGSPSVHEPWLEDWLNQDIARAGLSTRVRLLGGRKDPSRYHGAANAFLMLSRLDPFPLVVIEAMAAGTPVITFDEVTGAAELVRGKGGFVVPFLDINAVVHKLDQLFTNPALQTEIGETARSHITANHNFDDYVRDILALSIGRIGRSQLETLSPSRQRTRELGIEFKVRGHKIVFTTPDNSLSGVNVAISKLSCGLRERGWDVTVVVTRRPHLNSYYVPTAGDQVQLALGFEDSVPDQLCSLQQLVIQQSPAIVVLGYDRQTNVIASALGDDIGVVGWAHCDSQDYYEEIYRLGRYCNKIVAVSSRVAKTIAEINPALESRVELIPCSSVNREQLSRDRCYLGPEGELRLIYTGRLVEEQKRVQDFIPLTRALDALGIKYTLTLIGSDNDTGTLPKLLTGLSAGLRHGVVRILDRIAPDEVQRELQNHDIFVLLSDYEGLPLSLVEAMAAGCVPALTRIESGVSSIAKDQFNALVFTDRDWNTWARRLKDVQQDPVTLSRLGSKATITIEQGHLVDHFVERFDRLLLEVEGQLISQTFQRPKPLTWQSPFGDLVPPSNWIMAK